MQTATVSLRFYAELGDFLEPSRRGKEFTHSCAAGGSVKDVIESLGIPHTEVDLILVDGRSVGFCEHVQDGARISVYPVFEAMDISSVTLVRPTCLRTTRFVADVHLGRLARFLRICGLDTLYEQAWDDATLAQTSAEEHRILLTRDRGLLKRSVVTHGYLVRSSVARQQLEEVLERFDLWDSLRPLSRCPVCNSVLEPVAKEEIAQKLPPHTSARIAEFWLCRECDRPYWRGAHHPSLERLFRRGGLSGEGEAPSREQGHSE